MSRKSIIIATPDAPMRRRLVGLVAQAPDFEVIASSGDLMNTYTSVEEKLPNAVLIADILAALPEFEVMRGLFLTLDVRWLVVTSPNRPSLSAELDKGRADLLSVPIDADERTILAQLKSLTRTAVSRMPPASQTLYRSAIGRSTSAAPTPQDADAPLSKASPVSRKSLAGDKEPTLSSRTVSASPTGHDGLGSLARRAPSRFERDPRRVSESTPEPTGNRAGMREIPKRRSIPPVPGAPMSEAQAKASSQTERLIVIGSSTGGVDALLAVLSAFPVNCPPTLIVQHTGLGFGQSLARLLDRQCRASVNLATGRAQVRPGQVVIGAGIKSHLVVESTRDLRINLQEGPPVSGHVPSVDVLFRSVVALGGKVTAALLTGMGRDGADGMLDLHRAGARTVAQDEASSVVWGMPRAAAEIGAAQTILPLMQIGPALLAENRPNTSRRREVH